MSFDRNIKIAPSILSADFADFGREIRAIEDQGADWVHVDVMDGHFVPNISFGVPVLKSLHKGMPAAFYDVHLMISHPLAYAEPFAKAGATLQNFHLECEDDIQQTIDAIDAIYPLVQINTVEQIALSAVLDIHKIPVHPADVAVLHYHVFKEFRGDLATFFARYAGSSLAQWLAHWPEIDPAQRMGAAKALVDATKLQERGGFGIWDHARVIH